MSESLKKKLAIVAIITAAALLLLGVYFFSGSGAMAPGFQDAVKQRQQLGR
ncbi:MAG: hypothetical protein L6Q71_03585 [Planctomycetes bacterium]|nr:hypothetical protein [Planctomycetota bacterium]NUQ34528.1 hypothetical protein [Planctomycetaceae bacterium]